MFLLLGFVGQESHGVHICSKCGWAFPNPHPSAKHRRAHKRVCGKIEGFKPVEAEANDAHLPLSDDDGDHKNSCKKSLLYTVFFPCPLSVCIGLYKLGFSSFLVLNFLFIVVWCLNFG